MDAELIYTLVQHERGTYGFTEAFTPDLDIDALMIESIERTKRDMGVSFARVFYVQKTKHNANGSYQTDKDGNVIWKTLFLNEEVITGLRKAAE